MKKQAWKVEPKLIDRFLNVLADNDFKWMTSLNIANEFKPAEDGQTLLFIEEESKTLTYVRYSYYLDESDKSDEEYNITEVTEKWLDEREHDIVNHPSHYNHGDLETITIIEMLLTEEEYRGYLKGNILKYRERAPYKRNAEEDYAKAKWYFDKLLEIGF